MQIVGIIPARYASNRFPGKPLALIAGKPLIQHVVERCQQAKSLSEVIVATDDTRIWEVAQEFCTVEMTTPDHASGTDRIAEVVGRLNCDAVVNIQGDEPLIEPGVIDAVAGALGSAKCEVRSGKSDLQKSGVSPRRAGAALWRAAKAGGQWSVVSGQPPGAEMSTAAARIIDQADYEDPNVVKVVVNLAGRALYFSRRTIPYLRDAARGSASEQLAAFPFLKHVGIYGYLRETLLRLAQLPPSPLESAEKLEQLRALENDISIAVVQVGYEGLGVDVPEDVARVERKLKALKG